MSQLELEADERAVMDAGQVKDALYARHPGSGGQMPGAWTCVEEFRQIDLLAFSAWQSQQRYARVGYEVKVSRSDLRRELLRPDKRKRNVEWCNRFYLAVPRGLFTDDELAFDEPEWLRDPESFVRERCPERLAWGRGSTRCGTYTRGTLENGWASEWAPCEKCGGAGYLSKSRAELEAPTLWVPHDMGLVIIDGRGCKVVRESPKRSEVPVLDPYELASLVRWVSMRPDRRHHVARAA